MAILSFVEGYGRTVNPQTLRAKGLVEAIHEVIYNPIYKERISKCSDIVRSMPTPQETVLFWVEHILKFGGEHLRPASVDLPWYQFFMLDILLVVTVILHIVLFLVYTCVKYLVRKCSKPKQKME